MMGVYSQKSEGCVWDRSSINLLQYRCGGSLGVEGGSLARGGRFEKGV